MDDAQQFSVIAGVIILLACGVVYRNRRGRLLVATSAIGAALGAVAFPRLLGLVMGYRAAIEAIAASPGRSWRTELHELTAFYTAAPVADTTPRGMALGPLVGLAGGLLWPSRWCRLRRPPIAVDRAPDA
jgi:MFS family permease